MKRKTKQFLFAALGLLAVVGVLAAIKAAQIHAMMQAGASFSVPPETVTSTKVEARHWRHTLQSVGSLVAVQGVTVSAELGGTVKHIGFESGDSVKAGNLLVRLDTSTERAQL